MNLRPPSVTVLTHTSAINAVALQSPAMPNARMSLWRQSTHSFSFPPRPLRTAPPRFPKRFASAAARRSFGGAPPPNVVSILSFFFFFFFHLTYSRWTSSLPSCLWSQRIFPSLPGSRLTFFFYRDASSALLQLVNQWLNFTYSRSHAFRYERKNTNPTLVRIELTTSVLADVQLTY